MFWLRLSARLSRDSRKWWAAVVFGAAVMVVTAAYLVFQSLVVSEQQLLDRDLGRYSASIGYGTRAVQPGTDGVSAISNELRARGFTDVFVSLSVTDVPEGSVREGSWTDTPFPRRYILQQGEWADQPGEVVVASRDADGAPRIGKHLALLSGRMDLEVVGIATDRFAGDATTYLVGSGTWAAVPRSTAEKFPQVSAMPVVYWDGSRQGVMAKAFVAGHPDASGLKVDVVRGSLISSALLVEVNRGGTAANSVFAYALPSFGVPLLGAVVWWSLLRRRLLGHRRQLLDLGVQPGAAALVGVGAAVPPLAVAMLVGVAAGVGVAAAVRPLVETWHGQPLSPLAVPWDPFARSGLVLLMTGLVAFGWLWMWGRASAAPGRTRVRSRQRKERRPLARRFRRSVAVLAFLAALVMLPSASTPSFALPLAAACVVLGATLAPDALTVVTRVLPSQDFRLRMGARQLRSSVPASAGVAVIAATIGSAIAVTILLSTLIATMDSRQTPEVLPGQVIIPGGEGTVESPAAAEALRVVESLSLADRAGSVQLRYVTEDVERKPHVVVNDGDGFVMAVDTVAQARALLGDEWENRFDAALRSGGLIRWLEAEESEENAGTSVVLSYEGKRTPLAELDSVAAYEPRVTWAAPADALTLSSTMSAHGLPLSDGQVILTRASDSVAAEIRAALRERGLDTGLAVGYQKPPPPIPPAGLVTTAILLAAMALLMITVSTAGRVAELRPTLGVLLANGVPPSWIRQCVLFQEGTVLAVGIGVGIVFGAMPILASVPRFDGYWAVSMPWGQITILLAACVLGSAAAALLSARRLRPELHGSAVDPTS